MIKTIGLTVVVLALMVIAGCGPTAPTAPTGLTVTSNAPITLSWNSFPDATSYNVYRGTTSGNISTKTLLATNVNITTYTDSSAMAGVTYYYQVAAVYPDGTLSDASNEVSSFVLGGTKGTSQITLNWNSVSGAASYNVYRSTISAIITNKTRLSTGILTTTYADTSVISGTTYYYQVTAVDASGNEFQVSNETSVAF
jgi:fibronectin type 3 domain-containing protein